MPLVSIIIPAFNAAQTLAATIDAIIAQTFTDWELFVIDDGSGDDTPALAADYADRDTRIKVITNPGKGPSDARNFGALSCARGEILSFCDSDDIWTPYKLQDVVDAMADDDVDAVFGQVAFFVDNPQNSRSRSTVPTDPIKIANLLGENPICTTSNLSVRQESFAKTGGFESTLHHSEDLEWLIRLVGQGGVLQGINRLHVYYCTVIGGLSTNLEAMETGHARALRTAAQFDDINYKHAETVHLRYLARRALRVDAGAGIALRLAIKGLFKSPITFLNPPWRGFGTVIGALIAPFLPRTLRRAMFSR